MQKQAKKSNPFPQRQWRKYADDSRPPLYPPVLEMLSQCNRRAKAVSYKARMASTEYWDDSWDAGMVEDLAFPTGWRKWMRRMMGVFVFLPLAILLSMTLFGEVVKSRTNVDVWLSEAVWFSIMGCLVWIVLAAIRICMSPFLYWYVLGHELTHAVAVILSFGKVSGFRAALDGGHVQTNKNNLFIALFHSFVGVSLGRYLCRDQLDMASRRMAGPAIRRYRFLVGLSLVLDELDHSQGSARFKRKWNVFFPDDCLFGQSGAADRDVDVVRTCWIQGVLARAENQFPGHVEYVP